MYLHEMLLKKVEVMMLATQISEEMYSTVETCCGAALQGIGLHGDLCHYAIRMSYMCPAKLCKSMID